MCKAQIYIKEHKKTLKQKQLGGGCIYITTQLVHIDLRCTVGCNSFLILIQSSGIPFLPISVCSFSVFTLFFTTLKTLKFYGMVVKTGLGLYVSFSHSISLHSVNWPDEDSVFSLSRPLFRHPDTRLGKEGMALVLSFEAMWPLNCDLKPILLMSQYYKCWV